VKKLELCISGAFEDPCWEGLGIDPSMFIKQDILHGIHTVCQETIAMFVTFNILCLFLCNQSSKNSTIYIEDAHISSL